MSASLKAEEISEILNSYMSKMMDIIDKFGGDVIKFGKKYKQHVPCFNNTWVVLKHVFTPPALKPLKLVMRCKSFGKTLKMLCAPLNVVLV